MKLAVVLFNLGGPDSPQAVEPFLRNLFSDPAILTVPAVLRGPLAWFIAKRRAPFARAIYAKIGGASPILAETREQADALDKVLIARGIEAKAFIAMRCWHPFSDEAAVEVAAWQSDRIVLLPLYPQFSTTTTGSSFQDWERASGKAGITAPTIRICCYPEARGFIAAEGRAYSNGVCKSEARCRLSSAAFRTWDCPSGRLRRGDPYQWQVERTAKAIVDGLGIDGLDWSVCYQSRVGPLEWIGPATDAEIRRAGADGKGVVIAPIAFVSEHSETLVELDIDMPILRSRAALWTTFGCRRLERTQTSSPHWPIW
ncbi:MAG: ferrochelatase [Rhizomicrobium sp.]